ncbi:hypothetical protein ACWGB8_33770 [Kitasatospora sp. NPDC054939]
MTHQLRAEYGPSGRTGGVKVWHVVRSTDPAMAMCGRTMGEDAETEREEMWGKTERPCCQQCGSLYLHEAPFLPADHHRT